MVKKTQQPPRWRDDPKKRHSRKKCIAHQIVYHGGTRERRLIQKMKNSDCSGKREVAEA
jgi:hypothetical protein